MENYYSSHQTYTMQKDNKKISIFPLVDDNNVISQEPIYDRNGNFIRYLSKFRYIQTDNLNNQCMSFNILIDLDINLYNHDINYRNAIYSKLLSPNRISKIHNEYNKYAGGLYFDPKTHKYSKYIDPQILDGLDYKRKLEEQKSSSSFQKRRQDFLKRTSSIKPDHAEILSQSIYQEMYGKNTSYYKSYVDGR